MDELNIQNGQADEVVETEATEVSEIASEEGQASPEGEEATEEVAPSEEEAITDAE